MNPPSYAHLIFDKVTENICWRKDSFFNKYCWKKWLSACKNLKLDPCLSPSTNINSKWIKDFNITPESEVSTEKNKEYSGCNRYSKDFLNRNPAAQQLRERMELKSFCTTKEMVSKLKRPPTEWEKIFASYT
jgi:hypothetical protein